MQHAVVSKRGLSVSRCILKLRIRKQLHKSATRGKVHYRRNIPSRLFGANHDLVHRRTEYYSTTATHDKRTGGCTISGICLLSRYIGFRSTVFRIIRLILRSSVELKEV